MADAERLFQKIKTGTETLTPSPKKWQFATFLQTARCPFVSQPVFWAPLLRSRGRWKLLDKDNGKRKKTEQRPVAAPEAVRE